MESKTQPLLNTRSGTLALHGLRHTVRLGCTAEERQIPQFVRFHVKIRFPSLPNGCVSDDLHETVCYASLSHALRATCDRQEYQLIEKLGWEAFLAAQKIIPQHALLWLQVIKEKPPVPDLEGGASFSLGDWVE